MATSADHVFQRNGKFALLAFNNIYVDLPPTPFRLSDSTWVMPGLPVSDLGFWKEWIGSIQVERLQTANLVLFVEEPSDNPKVFDGDHLRLSNNLNQLYYLLNLESVIEYGGVDLLLGSSIQGKPEIHQMNKHRLFFQSKGSRRRPITQEWLEDAIVLRNGLVATEMAKPEFRRFIVGLNILNRGRKEEVGQDRLHQFVRALEALILPDIGATEKQFVHRCQIFAQANSETRSCLTEAYKMRSATEHMRYWGEAMQGYPDDQWEKICCQRTRQIEQLACATYSRLLRDATLREHFKTDDTIRAFWGLQDHEKLTIWGEGLDIT